MPDSLGAAFMARALRLAARGRYSTHPNPRVGCVIVSGNRIVGEGWHARAGGPHAEVMALRSAATAARGGDVYVTLEPCSHYGRTPPCADALVAAGVARVIAAMEDPNPAVSGRGMARLKEAGIDVSTGLMADEALALNRGFVSRMQRGRPFVHVKLAMSLDGRTAMASGESRWITGPAAREDVHRQRAEAGAVLVGIDTALADDPRLDVRLPGEWRQPVRIVLDSHLRLPAGARMLRPPGHAWIVTTVDDPGRHAPLIDAGAEIIVVPAAAGGVDLEAALRALAVREIGEVLVESGSRLTGALIGTGLVDEIDVYVAPSLLGDQARGLVSLPALKRLQDRVPLEFVRVRQVGSDLRITLRSR